MTEYEVIFSEPAISDLHAIQDYILLNFFSQQAADAKIALILNAVELLQQFTEAFPTVASRGYGDLTDDGEHYRYMPVENYLLFYYIKRRQIYISRILSTRQDWARIFMR